MTLGWVIYRYFTSKDRYQVGDTLTLFLITYLVHTKQLYTEHVADSPASSCCGLDRAVTPEQLLIVLSVVGKK